MPTRQRPAEARQKCDRTKAAANAADAYAQTAGLHPANGRRHRIGKTGQIRPALTAYQAALRSVPGDMDAKNKVDFQPAMIDGAKAMQLRKFPDAIQAYETQ